MFGKGINITQQTVDDNAVALVHFDSLLIIVCCDFIKRNTPKIFWQCAAVSGYFCRLGLIGRVMSARTVSLAEVRHMVKQGPWRTCDVWRV